MAELKLFASHIRSVEEAVEKINRHGWNLSYAEGLDGNSWFVYAGEMVILYTTVWEDVRIFLYGMALPYSRS